MSGGTESSRFTHLLQPIRDLSKNWNIDLAQELEEYLDELEHLNIAFDPSDDAAAVGVAAGTRLAQANAAAAAGNTRVMNFAEAALLIQGTSVIYSRKVEYLYALVFQTLAHLTRPQDTPASRGGGDAAGGDGEDGSGDDTSGGASDAHDVFLNPLPMVDELDEARNITLKSNSMDAQRQRGAAKSNTNIQASISLMGSLIPDERDHGETFKLLSCNLHASGVLLLDETSKKYLGAVDDDDASNDAQRGFGVAAAGSRSGADGPVAALNFDDVADDFFMDGGGDDDTGGDYGDADFGYNDDTGNELNTDGDDAASAGVGHNDNGDSSRRQVAFASPDKSTAVMARARRHQERDPWAPLDPYDASAAMSRPFRKGRSYPKPKKPKNKNKKKKSNGDDDDGDDDVVDGLDDPLFKERFFAGAARSQWTSWVWSETNERALERRFAKRFCKAPVLVKSCDALWRLESKWKALLRRRAAKDEQSAQAMLLQEQAEEDEAEQMHALGATMAHGVSALDLDLNTHVGSGDAEDDDDDGYNDDDGYDDGGAAFELGGGGDWDVDGSAGMASANSYAGGAATDDPNRPQSYEDICRQHIASFMQGSEKYVRESNLTKQVNDWQSKLAPILKEQDAHPPFDIHTYGRDILGHLVHETKFKSEEQQQQTPKRKAEAITTADEDGDDTNASVVVPFGEIVGGMSQYEVCRMFLASLQLANNGNVQLVHGHSAAEQSRVPFQMTLLSTANVYESLQQQDA